MLAKYTIAGLAGSALLASVAFAQTPSTSDRPAATAAPSTATVAPASMQSGWRASKLVGLNVYNEANESIGEINELLLDQKGDIKAVVLGVGGFLGIGEHLVAVPFEQVKFVDTPVASTSAAAPRATDRPATTTSSTTTAPSTTTGAATTTTTTSMSKSNPWYPDHAVLSATKEQLKAMPEFKFSTQ